MGSKMLLSGKNGQTALNVLQKVTAILENNEIEYMLDYGTLPGIIREQRLLPWDSDVDISITKDQLDKFLKSRWKFWLAGLRMRVRRFSKDTGPFKKMMLD